MRKFIYVFVCLLSITSCLDDKTNYDYRDINDWTEQAHRVVLNIQESYVLYPGESVTIEPVVRLSKDTLNPDVSYVWYIDGEKVGDESTYTYVGEKVGTYNMVVSVIDNATKVSWSRGFDIVVKSPIETGWLFLTRSASGASEISMLTGKVYSRVGIDEDGYEDETILLDEQGEHDDEEDDEEYEPQLTTDPMHAEQWYESLDEENDKYSVLREALDKLDAEDDEAEKVKTKIKRLRSQLKA